MSNSDQFAVDQENCYLLATPSSKMGVNRVLSQPLEASLTQLCHHHADLEIEHLWDQLCYQSLPFQMSHP
ncbi:MAG: hypothetical protein F6K36_10160 [Symploca sp. SIO3C6]|uniref:Uncharacterized protein n=1 Tax=Symploca sp. SIO1C4 TaxID=2607765 RepID=A0A6B3NI85_9CYAN|nr:hypothetical protein [Symploca sp. SIO3C6]NER30272.1 hypothetical protein [Symploca sp. SIO1C4]NET04974.1 hypothetical protein [Symploca sp. SIO2B6]